MLQDSALPLEGQDTSKLAIAGMISRSHRLIANPPIGSLQIIHLHELNP